MGFQTLIILLSIIGFIPDQGRTDIPYQKYGLVQGQYLIAQDLDELFPKSKSYSSPVSTPIIKSIKPHGAGLHISASVGFCELFHSGDDGDMHKPGFTYKFSGDYWFGDHFGLGIELQFLNLFGSHSNGDFRLSNHDEFNYYVSPYIKVGLFTTQNQRLFFNFGFGYGEPSYGKDMGDGPYPNSKRILVKFDIGWSIKFCDDYETGIIIDNKLMEAGSPGSEYGGSALFLLSVSPFIGYVF